LGQLCSKQPIAGYVKLTLGGSTNGAKTDGEPEHFRTVPFVISLIRQRIALFLRELGHRHKVFAVSSYESSTAEELCMLAEIVAVSERLSIGNDLLA